MAKAKTMAKLLDEIYPGEILLEDFLKPMGISARKLAQDIDRKCATSPALQGGEG